METVPYILDLDELGVILDNQEKLEKLFGDKDNQKQMDTFLLEEVLDEDTNERTAKKREIAPPPNQSNQVCFFEIFLKLFKVVKVRN